MDSINICLAIAGILIALLLLYRLQHIILHSVFPIITYKCLQYLQLPRLIRHSSWVMLTRLEILCISAYVIFNILPLSIDYNTLQKKAATLAIANLLLTSLGSRTHPIVEFVCISTTTYPLIYRWTGRVVFIHACIHFAGIIQGQRSFPFGQTLSGYIVSISNLVY